MALTLSGRGEGNRKKTGVLGVLGVPGTLQGRNYGGCSRGTPLRKMWNTSAQEHKRCPHLRETGGATRIVFGVPMERVRSVNHASAKAGQQEKGGHEQPKPSDPSGLRYWVQLRFTIGQLRPVRSPLLVSVSQGQPDFSTQAPHRKICVN